MNIYSRGFPGHKLREEADPVGMESSISGPTLLPSLPSGNARLFLVDHMCVLPYGHNLNALVLFKNILSDGFRETFCLATRDLPDYVEEGADIERVLTYPYAGLVERAPKKLAGKEKSGDRKPSAGFARRLKSLRRPARRAFYTALNEFANYDIVRRRTRGNWRNILKRYGVGSDDVIFFPSAEYFGCLGLLDVLKKMPPAARPKVHFRMIGVMENANYAMRPGRPEFLSAIREALAAGITLGISAETPAYANYIERLAGTPVAYLPYPLANGQAPIRWQETKVVASPGQGRGDKGFFRLYSIIERLNTIGANGPFAFDVQNMRKTDPAFRARYSSLLNQVPGMNLRPARLSQQEIDAVYSGSDILVLPYDPKVYALRGSAVLQEGLAFGRPVVCSDGLGLSEQVERYGCGYLATSDHSFADRINELASLPRQAVIDKMTAARRAYEKDFETGLRAVFEELHTCKNS